MKNKKLTTLLDVAQEELRCVEVIMGGKAEIAPLQSAYFIKYKLPQNKYMEITLLGPSNTVFKSINDWYGYARIRKQAVDVAVLLYLEQQTFICDHNEE